jgi:hypothetical protein
LWHKIEEKEGLRRRRAGRFALLQAVTGLGQNTEGPVE